MKVDAMALTFEDEKLMHGTDIFEREADPQQIFEERLIKEKKSKEILEF